MVTESTTLLLELSLKFKPHQSPNRVSFCSLTVESLCPLGMTEEREIILRMRLQIISTS